ncbi:MAG: helix-turn-helix domain-containing protein [Candidatus Paceibacterota bacterium]
MINYQKIGKEYPMKPDTLSKSSNLDRQWKSVQTALQKEIGCEKFEAWFGSMRVESFDTSNQLHVSVATDFLRDWIINYVSDALLKCWKEVNASIDTIVVISRAKERFGTALNGAVESVEKVEPTLLIPAKAPLEESTTPIPQEALESPLPVQPQVPEPKAEMSTTPSLTKVVSIRDVAELVCLEFQVALTEMESKKRTRRIVEARQLAMALHRELTGKSFKFIGSKFGGRDHSTVLIAVKRVAELRKDKMYASMFDQLAQQLRERVSS